MNNVKCLVNGKFAVVENGVRCSAFLLFATGTTPGSRRFSCTVIRMIAFSAYETLFPLDVGNKLKRFVAIGTKSLNEFRV